MAQVMPRVGIGAGRCSRSILLPVLALAAMGANADAGWFESGDTQLRMDLQLLNDAEVIRYPASQWPIPRAALEHALKISKEHFAVSAAVREALQRVRARVEPPLRPSFDSALRGGEPGLLRDFDSVGREDVEIAGSFKYARGSFSAGLTATLVADPKDGQELRADGSHLSWKAGNWLLSAHALDRWWGPGHESSLILSSNARPMPTLAVERAAAIPFETKWLSWLGPWRFSFAVSQMEYERQDIDAPLFMAWRVVVMPLKDLELGFSRTAQFCGEELRCSASSFWDLLIGNDNPGFDATVESEPGNQMGGFDLRWASPLGDGPYALYGQYVGEDESGYLPAKYLGQLGFEVWKPFSNGGLLLFFAEYANTACSGLSSSGPYYNCAYTQGQFNAEGYRYRGRVIGHTADNDAETFAFGAIHSHSGGALWSVTARTAQLNQDGLDPRNTVSAKPADYAALEFGWRGKWRGEAISIELGAEALRPEGGDTDVEPFGFIGWRHEFSL